MIRLVFDFPHAHAAFTSPVETLVARTLEEMGPAVGRIREATAAGLHAAGFIAYEAAPAFEPAMRVRPAGAAPLLWFGLFEEPESEEGITGRDERGSTASPEHCLDWRLDWTAAEHAAAVAEVRDAIAAGRTYQVNLTTRLRASWPYGGDGGEGDGGEGGGADPAWSLYQRMRRAQGPGYHAYLDLGRHVILSASPELFFRTEGRRITTRPMKGTRPRGRWPAEDRALRDALASSEKDRAENLMIVDLLRNDLGRVCETGTVTVPSRHEIERYRTVWQMTSTVEGRLRDDATLLDVLAALFPCGSVTGAPKISTMGEIARLETSPRGVYCGAIGWVRPGGDCTFSVPIRTAWLDRDAGTIEYGTGGGVVWDSTAEGEYDELRAKAVVIRDPWPDFALLETLPLRDGALPRRARHLARMRASAEHFGFRFPAEEIDAALDDLARRHPSGDLLARLTLGDDGAVTADARPLDLAGEDSPRPAPGDGPALPTIALAADPVDSASPFLYHKTTWRDAYDRRLETARAAAPNLDLFDVLLHNERGEVTEFTRGNVVLELDGELVTPPLESGLLPGCLREELLESGDVAEQVVARADLARASRVWFINSARGWVKVDRVAR